MNGIAWLALLFHPLIEPVTAGTIKGGPQQQQRDLEEEEEVLLPFDVVGEWIGRLTENCFGLYAGKYVREGIFPDLDFAFNNAAARQVILTRCEDVEQAVQTQHHFQDCMEITITNGLYVHHFMMNDDEYFMDDIYDGEQMVMQFVIEAPLPEEAADGAVSVGAIYPYDLDTETRLSTSMVRRYINSDGNLVLIQQAMTPPDPAYDTEGTWVFRKTADYAGCRPYEPTDEHCQNKEYTDTPYNWTTACCENYGGDGFFDQFLQVPRPEFYDGERAIGNRDCTVPPGSAGLCTDSSGSFTLVRHPEYPEIRCGTVSQELTKYPRSLAASVCGYDVQQGGIINGTLTDICPVTCAAYGIGPCAA